MRASGQLCKKVCTKKLVEWLQVSGAKVAGQRSCPAPCSEEGAILKQRLLGQSKGFPSRSGRALRRLLGHALRNGPSTRTALGSASHWGLFCFEALLCHRIGHLEEGRARPVSSLSASHLSLLPPSPTRQAPLLAKAAWSRAPPCKPVWLTNPCSRLRRAGPGGGPKASRAVLTQSRGSPAGREGDRLSWGSTGSP